MSSLSLDKLMAIKLASLKEADQSWLLAQICSSKRGRLERHLKEAKKFVSLTNEVKVEPNSDDKLLPRPEKFSSALNNWFNSMEKDQHGFSAKAIERIRGIELEVINNG
ncbi:hypothetical protein [Agaribacter flavus]|uniref:Uncharacterized protein n=1 Tax=Agaribacter flavus TaxID=1902781 RepID=A0ABV7FS60_9ALTE